MPKLTDKQKSLLYLGGGLVVAIIFLLLSYSDNKKIKKIKRQQRGVQNQINRARSKQKKLPRLKSKLYVLRANYEIFKRVLPTKKEVLGFYETLDEFRKKAGLPPWNNLGIVRVEKLKKKKKTAAGKQKKKKKKPRRRRRKPKPGAFVATKYKGSVLASLDELGKLLNLIELHDSYFGVENISIPPMAKRGNDLRTTINLTMLSYTYPNPTPIDAEADRLLKGFTPDIKVQNQVESLQKQLVNKNPFKWSKPARNPFDKSPSLGPKVQPDKGKKPKAIKIVEPKSSELTLKEIEKLEATSKVLEMLAKTGNWEQLHAQMNDYNFEPKLMGLVLNNNNDPTGELKKRTNKMRKQLKEWKRGVKRWNELARATAFLARADKKIQEMTELYEKGKSKGSHKILQQVIKKHNVLIPEIREFAHLEQQIPELVTVRKKTEKLYSKAEIQIKIIKLSKKLKLRGIIHIRDNPELSVAFINNKIVHKDDILMMGFVVQEVRPEEVILRYKEETVPIRLKRAVKGKNLVKRSS